MKWRGRLLLLATGIGLLLSFLIWSFFPTVRIGVDAQRAPYGLPNEAINVSYYQRGAFGPASYVEFDIAEDAFVKWVEGRGWQAEEIKGVVRAWRPPQFVDSSATRKGEVIEVRRGLSAAQYDANNPDSGISVIYDRQNHRAYFQISSR